MEKAWIVFSSSAKHEFTNLLKGMKEQDTHNQQAYSEINWVFNYSTYFFIFMDVKIKIHVLNFQYKTGAPSYEQEFFL